MPDLTIEENRAIVELAIKHGAYPDWDDPADASDDVKVASAAKDLISQATDVSRGGSQNEVLIELLHMARVMPLSDKTREAYVRHHGGAPVWWSIPETNGHGPDDVAPDGTALGQSAFAQTSPPPAPGEAQGSPAPTGSAAFAEPASETAPSGGEEHHATSPVQTYDISQIFPGYDDLKVSEIKAAIIASAADGSLTESEWEQIKAYEAVHEERKTILSLQPQFKAPEPESSAQPHESFKYEPQPAGHDAVGTPEGESLTKTYDQGPQRARQEGLPIPHDANPDVPPLPIDITSTTDQQLSNLGVLYHNLYARAQWLISQEEGRAAVAEHLEREAERDEFVKAYALHREQIPEDKRSQPTALEAARKQAEKDAEVHENVRRWRSRKVSHGVEVRELKALMNGWDKAVWRIDKELDRRSRASTVGRAAS